MKIALVISHLGCGGQERVMCLMANYWAKVGYEVVLMTLAHKKEKSAFPIDEQVQRVSAQDIRSRVPGKFGKVLSFRRMIMTVSPDIIISFGDDTNVITLFALAGTRVPIIISERTNPVARKQPMMRSLFRFLTYRYANYLVNQTHDADWFFRNYMEQSKRTVIPNPVLENDDRESQSIGIKLQPNALIMIGRLIKSKGYDRLIDIFQRISAARPAWHLYIAGEGSERHKLEKLIKDKGLQERVALLGYVANPAEVLNQADIFVFTSQYEGFPNALCEAMAAGLPVISFDCPSGPADIIENNSNGILVANGDHEAFVTALIDMIDHPEKRVAIGKEAEKIKDSLSIETIAKQWESLF